MPRGSVNERQALGLAALTSGLALLITFGFAFTMRHLPSLTSRTSDVANRPMFIATRELASDADQGHRLFLMNCAHCHGDDARGDEGPDLHDLHKNDARIRRVITAGIKGEMPSFSKKLGDPEIRSLTAYLRTLKS